MNTLVLPEIGHVGYLVKDIDSHVKAFSEELGLKDYIVYDFVPQRAWCYGTEIFNCKFRISLYTPKKGAKIELVQFVSGDNTPHEKFMKEHGEGIHHIAYYVDNYDECREYFRSLAGGAIIFEAYIEDEVLGKRSSFYATAPGYPSVIEISRKTSR